MDRPTRDFQATSANAYAAMGLGPVEDIAHDLRPLYLDLMKRILCNIIYEDIALWSYNERKEFSPLGRFALPLRLRGEDVPAEAHTLIGWHRLTNLEFCAERVITDGVGGDFVETGVLRGGAAIFMRAALKAYGATDRKVYACDTFVAPGKDAGKKLGISARLIFWLVSLATRIPNQAFQLKLFRFLEKHQKSFPRSENPSSDWIRLSMEMVRFFQKNPQLLPAKDRVSLDAVKSHFARYGLLDDQVVFLQGFFSDTLPKAPLDQIAILRCDGDSFESTMSVLQILYPKVSEGGFIIIDDYNSFSDCSRAVDTYRSDFGITEPMVAIDQAASYWRKSRGDTRHLH